MNELKEIYKQQFIINESNSGKRLSVLVRLVKQQDNHLTLEVHLGIEDPPIYLNQGLISLGLTKREREVVCLLCRGLQNKEISDKLCISRYTVEAHIRSIFEKLGVNNRTSLIHRAITLS